MEDSLNIGEWTDDPFKNTEIYTAFIKKTILEDADKEALQKERGFSDEIIDLCKFRSCRPENREVIKELQEQFGEDALLEAGLLEATDKGIKPCTQLLGAYKNDKFVNNICIPYFNPDGEIFYIRPHKFGLKQKQIQVYCTAKKVPPDSTWIITESEFKAAAALQFGYAAIGLPGIHSFMVKHLPRLLEFIKTLGVHNIVVIYDNEIKTNPEFKNYKPDVLKQWDTQWRSVDICRKLIKSLPELNGHVKIGVLPDAWMVDGKIDIDGALAQGRTQAEFKSVLYKAVEWEEYVQTLPSVAKKIITRKVYKEDYLESSKIKRMDNGYFVERQKKIDRENVIPFDERVSNFTMEIKKTLVEGDTHIREVVFRGQDGSISRPHLCKAGTNILRDFKTWVWSCGDYHFTGKQEDLDLIWKLEGALCDGREILRPEQIGRIDSEEGTNWLFGNVLLKEDGTALLPDDEGIIWEGLRGYLPQSIKQESKSKTTATNARLPTINLLGNKEVFGITEIKKLIKDIETVYDNKSIRLAVGWIVACLLSDEIFKKYACFPILFIGGKRECGKTTLGNWLMAMAGMPDTAGDSIGASEAGVVRKLAWFGSLPAWFDEYRNSSRIKNKWESFLRNVYQRQTPSKGTLGSGIRTHDIKAGVLLSGEETPQDNALLSRCIIIPLVKNKDKSKTLELYREIENLRTQNLMSRLIPEVIKLKSALLPTVLEHIDGWKKRLLSAGVGERMALNHAIPAVCYDLFFLRDEPLEVRQEFTKWVVEESHRNEKEKESEHMLSEFMESLVHLQDDLEPFYTVYTQNDEPKGKRRIALHFPTFYTKWTESYRRQGHEQFKSKTMLSYVREEKYYIEDNKLKRIGGKPLRSLILSLDPEDEPPDSLLYLADGGGPEVDERGISDAISTMAGPDGIDDSTDELF